MKNLSVHPLTTSHHKESGRLTASCLKGLLCYTGTQKMRWEFLYKLWQNRRRHLQSKQLFTAGQLLAAKRQTCSALNIRMALHLHFLSLMELLRSQWIDWSLCLVLMYVHVCVCVCPLKLPVLHWDVCVCSSSWKAQVIRREMRFTACRLRKANVLS